MPPPNLDATTAIEITSLDYSVTTDPENNGNTLWYKYTATADDEPAIGMHSFGTGTYRPQIGVYLGPDTAPTALPAGSGFFATRKAIVVPVEAGTEYFIEITGGLSSSYGAGDTFTFRAYNAPTRVVPRGAILVPDDTPGFPAVMLDPDTGEVLRFVSFPSGERADSLTSGHILTEDLDNPSDLQLYDGRLNHVATLSGLASGTMRIRSNGGSLFYTSNGTTLKTVTTTGTTPSTWTLAVTPVSLAPNRDDTIAYYASSGAAAAVRRWDLVGNTALSDLAAGVASYFVGGDMFVLADGTILVHYFKTSGGVDHFIRRYSTAGAILQTYAFGTTDVNHLAWSSDDDHIRVWSQASGQGTFKDMNLTTATFTASWSHYDTVAGVSEEPATATPQEFGHSFSCPFITYFGPASVVEDLSEPCCPCDCPPAPGAPGGTGPSGSESSAPLPSHTGSILPPVLATWIPACTGGGDVPTASDATDSESWVS